MSVKDKRFYWLKLNAEFMQGDIVDFLMSQKNGANYVVLYQMLCLKTINTQGQLASEIGDILIPFDEEKIERECKWFDIDTIRVAMNLYSKLGLIYEQENGIIRISKFEDMVGSETYWAKQKKLERAKNKEVGLSLENVQNPIISNSNVYKSNILDVNSISNSNNKDYLDTNNNKDCNPDDIW